MFSIHCIQHVPFENPGCILEWAQSHQYPFDITHVYRQESLPTLDRFDWLILMGGPMSVNDESLYPWLIQEKRFIESALKADKKIIGICLGAQLLASVLGASVYSQPEKEIGWHPIRWNKAAKSKSCFAQIPDPLEVFHWHGETFTLPANSVVLADSAACEHQAFFYGEQALALQFHLEVKPENVQSLVDHCRSDLTPSRFVQSEAVILQKSSRCRILNGFFYKILNNLLSSDFHV